MFHHRGVFVKRYISFLLAIGICISVSVVAEGNPLSIDSCYRNEVGDDGRGVLYFNKNDFFDNVEDDVVLSIPNQINGCPVFAIGDRAFLWAEYITSITIPEGVEIIGESAFANINSLVEMQLPESLRIIKDFAFAGNEDLVDIKLGSNISYIGESVFASCHSLEQIVIPSSVTHIGVNPFYECLNLKSIEVDNSNTLFSSIDNMLISNHDKRLISYAIGCCEKIVDLPHDLIIIGESSFRQSSVLRVILHDSVKTIENEAFTGCNDLVYMNIPESVTSIGERAFEGCVNIHLGVKKGSFADEYANLQGIPCVAIP